MLWPFFRYIGSDGLDRNHRQVVNDENSPIASARTAEKGRSRFGMLRRSLRGASRDTGDFPISTQASTVAASQSTEPQRLPLTARNGIIPSSRGAPIKPLRSPVESRKVTGRRKWGSLKSPALLRGSSVRLESNQGPIYPHIPAIEFLLHENLFSIIIAHPVSGQSFLLNWEREREEGVG